MHFYLVCVGGILHVTPQYIQYTILTILYVALCKTFHWSEKGEKEIQKLLLICSPALLSSKNQTAIAKVGTDTCQGSHLHICHEHEYFICFLS